MSQPERPNKYEFSSQERSIYITRFNKGLVRVVNSSASVAPFAAGILNGLVAGSSYPFPVFFERITDSTSLPFQTYFSFANISETDELQITPAISMPISPSMSEKESVPLIAESLAGSLVYMQTFLSKEWDGLYETIVRRSFDSTAAYMRSAKSDFILPEQSIRIANTSIRANQHLDLTPLPEDSKILDIRLPGQIALGVRDILADEIFADCTLLQFTQVARALLAIRRLQKISPGAYANLSFIADYPQLSLEDQETVYNHFAVERWLKAQLLSTKLIEYYTYETLLAKTPEEQQNLFAQALLLELFNNPEDGQR